MGFWGLGVWGFRGTIIVGNYLDPLGNQGLRPIVLFYGCHAHPRAFACLLEKAGGCVGVVCLLS